MSKAALEGIRVIDFGEMVAGPYCAKLFADLGADVIKAEPPEGDPARAAGPFPRGKPHLEKSALYLYLNTSKRGITLDLTKPEGKDVFTQLIRWADALVDNHAPSYLKDRGFDDVTLLRLNPSLVYTSITPYGRTGPRADVKGDELTLSHAGGLGNLLPVRSQDISRAPVKPGGYAAGYYSALTAAFVALGAVLGARKSGQGRSIDVSMQEVMLSFQRPGVTGARYHGSYWGRVPDRPPAMGRMQTSDGYVVLGAVEDHHFRNLREMMGNPPWMQGDQWLNMAYRNHHFLEIAPLMDEWMLKQTKADVHEKLGEKGVPVGPVNSPRDLLQDRQYMFRDYFKPLTHPVAGTQQYPGWPYMMPVSPPRMSAPAPLLGEHNEAVLTSVLGYTAAEFAAVKKSGALGKAKR